MSIRMSRPQPPPCGTRTLAAPPPVARHARLALAALALVAAALVLAALARASETARAPRAGKDAGRATGAPRPLVSGLAVVPSGAPANGASVPAQVKVAIDPVTGAIARPDARQIQALGLESLRRAQGPALIARRFDGTVTAYLEDRCLSYSVARVDAAGDLHGACVSGAEAAHRALQARVPARAQPAKAAQ